VVIISPRRVGKSSLIARVVEELRRDGVLVASLDLLRSPTKQQFTDNLAQALADGIVSPVERALDKMRRFFSHLAIAPRVTVAADGRPQFEFLGYERDEDVDAVIDGLLELPGRIAAESDRRVVLVLDEFQEIVALDDRLPGRLRAVFQHQSEVAHVYLGSKRHLMEPLFMDRAAPLYRSAKPMALGPIPRRAFSRFLRARFRAGGVQASPEAIERVLELTAGWPYETQELCSFAWVRAQVEGGPVDAALIERALSDLIDAESARYLAVWDRLSGNQRALLLAVAHEPGRVYSEAFRRRHRLGASSTVQGSLGALERLELVEPTEAGHAVADVFMRTWLTALPGTG
jgi:AAA+ ATPase superfamily predicted ATPase